MNEELDEYEIEEHREPFTIDSDDEAAWAMRKFAASMDKIKENIAIVEKERVRWVAWLDSVNYKHAKDAYCFEGLLIDYMRREREINDRKSISLPHGTVKSVATQEKIVPLNGFVQWAQEANRDDLLTFAEPKPNIAAIKKAANANEIDFDFVEVVPASVSYSVKVSE